MAIFTGDIFKNICLNLKLSDLYACSRVSKIWSQESGSDLLWELLCRRDFLSQLQGYAACEKTSYKDLYKAVYKTQFEGLAVDFLEKLTQPI